MTRSVSDWFIDDESQQEALKIHRRLKFLDRKLFSQFESLDRDKPGFMDRFSHWVAQGPDEEDRLAMFRLVADLYFLGRDEVQQLHEDVFQTIVAWWLIDTFDLECIPRVPAAGITEALDSTWFTAITDSLELARFHHINGISGKNLRPDWGVLSRLGDPERIREYMSRERLRAIVVMEDFVGSGSQAEGPLKYLLDNFDTVPVLFAPLVACLPGNSRIRALANQYSSLTYTPLVLLGESVTVTPLPSVGEHANFADYRRLFEHVRPMVGYRHRAGHPREADFGFAETGSLAILYSNCPNNVPPLIHHENPPHWSALFPRTIRK